MTSKRLLGAMLTLIAANTSAADWSYDPRVTVSGLYNDNYQLTDIPSNEIDVAGAELNAELGLRAQTPRSLLRLTPRWRSTYLPGDESQEADDYFVPMLAKYETERGVALIRLDYSSIVTLGSFFPSATVSEGDVLGERDPGVGVGSAGRNRQDRILIRPRVGYDLFERHRVELDFEYLDVTYDIQVSGDREDYQNALVAIGYQYQLSETSSLAIRAGISKFEPADDESTDAQGLNVEWRNRISDTAEAYVRAGGNRVESIDDDGDSTWDTGFSGGAGVRWKFEVTDVWLDATTNLDPNSTGEIVNRNHLWLQVGRQLSPKSRLSVGGRVIDDSGTGDSEDSFTDRTYAVANMGYEWRFARTWALVAWYEYSWQEFQGSPTNAQANSLKLGVTWEPNRR